MGFFRAKGRCLWLACGLAAVFSAAAAWADEPAYACMQTGRINAMPPIMSEPIDIKECSEFSGEKRLAEQIGQQWCNHAAGVQMGRTDSPPKVEKLQRCPDSWLATCYAPMPPQGADGKPHAVVVWRRYYVASPGAGGLEGLRETCETEQKGEPSLPRGQFLLPGQEPKPY
jgi:hypothetical protein